MKLKKRLLLLVVATIAIAAIAARSHAQSPKLYQQLAPAEQTAFVGEQARRIARQTSGRDYQFTTEFEGEIQKAVAAYARRIGNNAGDIPGKGDPRFALERGQTLAPTLIKIFKAHHVSPLIGLYLPFVESEYLNISTPNVMGAVGMFQFLPATGEQYGLKTDERLDVEKSADAAARYIEVGLKRFGGDPMKEALALLAYNRGIPNVEHDVATLVTQQNRACSICALTEQRDKLDKAFRGESVFYVPYFFAAAIVGENPQAFGLSTQPLSSFETK